MGNSGSSTNTTTKSDEKVKHHQTTPAAISPPSFNRLDKSNDKYDQMYKVLMIGDSGVGKTALSHRYCDFSFDDKMLSTIGVDFQKADLEDQTTHKKYRLLIWDSAGQERFRVMTSTYYRGVSACILVFDLSDPSSFTKMQKWIDDMNKHDPNKTALRILVGNKADLVKKTGDGKYVNEIASYLAKGLDMMYVETSAKAGSNISQLFEDTLSRIILAKSSA